MVFFAEQREFEVADVRQFVYDASTPWPENIEFLKHVKQANQLKVALISNEGQGITEHRIAKFGLRELADFESGAFRSLLTEVRFLDTHRELPFEAMLARLIEERVLRRHLWIALRKLRYQSDYTFLFEPDNGRIRLRGKDEVAGFDIVNPNGHVLVITQNGFGKLTPMGDYPVKSRNIQGVYTVDQTAIPKIGEIVGMRVVDDLSSELMVISTMGQVIRIPLEGVRISGRQTRGVIIMRLDDGDRAASIAGVGAAGTLDA